MKIEGDVKSGETLAFDSYLVDIGDLHGDKKSMVNENSEVRDKNIDMKPRSLHSHKVRNSTAIGTYLYYSPVNLIVWTFKHRS